MSEVVIIGGGVIGTATAHALVERGITDITIVDRDTVGSGGTGRSAGIIRCHYGVSSVCALAVASLEFFENAQDILGSAIGFEQVGYLVGVGEENLEPFRASLANQRSLGVDTREIGQGEAKQLWPTAFVDDFATFCYEPRGGYADGYATAQAYAGWLRSHGVAIRQGTAVKAIRTDGQQVSGVELADGEIIAAAAVVLAAGAWSVPLLAPLGIELPIQPMLIQEVLIDPGVDLGAPPVFSDLVAKQYVHLRGGEMLFGNSSGKGATRPVDDPDSYPAHASNAAIEATAEKALHRFPGIADPRVATTSTGVIDQTPDNNPIISATRYDGLILATGMSGHGYKIAPAIGQLTADLIVGAQTVLPNVRAADFRLSRFAEDDLLVSPFAYQGTAGIR